LLQFFGSVCHGGSPSPVDIYGIYKSFILLNQSCLTLFKYLAKPIM